MTQLDALMEGYMAYKADVSRLAPGTIRDIRCTLKRASIAMAGIAPDTPLWRCRLEDYLAWIYSERDAGTSELSLNKFITHCRGLLDYAWRSKRVDRNVLDGFQLQLSKGPEKPKSITEAEAHQLIQSLSIKTFVDRRDRVVVLILYGCGLRTHELCALDISHVDIDRQELQVLTAKGDKPRTVPIPTAVFTELLAYLHERGGKRGPLFRTHHKRRRISNKDASAIVKRAAVKAKLSTQVTPKTLRHSFATHLMDRGVDIGIIASLMGHRSPKETGIYLHVLPGRQEEAVAMLNQGESL